MPNPPSKSASAPIDWKYSGPVPKFIAQVDEQVDKVEGTFKVRTADGQTRTLNFGKDITYGIGGKLPHGQEVPPTVVVDSANAVIRGVEKFIETGIKDVTGKKVNLPSPKNPSYEEHLKKVILVLPRTYDTTNMALREFDTFLTKKSAPQIYTDPKLDQTVARDGNFIAFSEYTLNAPGLRYHDPSRFRLHQALKAHGWNINLVTPLKGLEPMAFNSGFKYPPFNTGDYVNGLTIMIDEVSHALIFVKYYYYNSALGKYDIDLIFELYDAFGLDDDDVGTYGFLSQPLNRFPQNLGFTAWWQLQHQFAYAPLVTKVFVTRSFRGIQAI